MLNHPHAARAAQRHMHLGCDPPVEAHLDTPRRVAHRQRHRHQFNTHSTTLPASHCRVGSTTHQSAPAAPRSTQPRHVNRGRRSAGCHPDHMRPGPNTCPAVGHVSGHTRRTPPERVASCRNTGQTGRSTRPYSPSTPHILERAFDVMTPLEWRELQCGSCHVHVPGLASPAGTSPSPVPPVEGGYGGICPAAGEAVHDVHAPRFAQVAGEAQQAPHEVGFVVVVDDLWGALAAVPALAVLERRQNRPDVRFRGRGRRPRLRELGGRRYMRRPVEIRPGARVRRDQLRRPGRSVIDPGPPPSPRTGGSFFPAADGQVPQAVVTRRAASR